MIHNILKDKPTKLFLGFTAFFVANALIAEIIGGKIFSLEKLFGMNQASFSLFGEKHLSFDLTCGVLLWPLETQSPKVAEEPEKMPWLNMPNAKTLPWASVTAPSLVMVPLPSLLHASSPAGSSLKM